MSHMVFNMVWPTSGHWRMHVPQCIWGRFCAKWAYLLPLVSVKSRTHSEPGSRPSMVSASSSTSLHPMSYTRRKEGSTTWCSLLIVPATPASNQYTLLGHDPVLHEADMPGAHAKAWSNNLSQWYYHRGRLLSKELTVKNPTSLRQVQGVNASDHNHNLGRYTYSICSKK